jgi:hypothetical protein
MAKNEVVDFLPNLTNTLRCTIYKLAPLIKVELLDFQFFHTNGDVFNDIRCIIDRKQQLCLVTRCYLQNIGIAICITSSRAKSEESFE